MFPYLLILFAALPFVEVYLLFIWFEASWVTALAYTATTMLVGAICIRTAKTGFVELSRHLRGDAPNIRMLLLFGKMWLVGTLLFFPGYLGDIVAVCILIAGFGSGGRGGGRGRGGNAGGDDVIEVKGGFVADEADEVIEDKRQ